MKSEDIIRQAAGSLQQALGLLLAEQGDSANLTFHLYATLEVLDWVLGENGEGWLYPLCKADKLLCMAGSADEPALARADRAGQGCKEVPGLEIT